MEQKEMLSKWIKGIPFSAILILAGVCIFIFAGFLSAKLYALEMSVENHYAIMQERIHTLQKDTGEIEENMKQIQHEIKSLSTDIRKHFERMLDSPRRSE